MRTKSFVVLLAIAGNALCLMSNDQAYGQNCAAPDPVNCGATQRSAPVQRAEPRGFYSRSPDTGEFSGENNSIGVRGFGLRLPSISLEMPELRLPSLARYRRGPFMTTDSTRAPFVEGRALEFNPVGPDRNVDDRSVPTDRFVPTTRAPSCNAPAPRCDAPAAAVPAADERAEGPTNSTDPRDAQLQQLREQAVLLQKAIDSLASGPISNAVASSERSQLQQKDREIAELRLELQRMQSTVGRTAAQSASHVQPTGTKAEQQTSRIRSVSGETQKNTRVGSKPVVQNSACNGPQCKPQNSPPRTQPDDGFEPPVVTKTYTASRLSKLRPSSILSR